MRDEFELIAMLRGRLAAGGAMASPRLEVASGDDAAVVRTEGAIAVSVDALVDGTHFRRGEWPPEAVGAKALAAALSDLAAMGAAAGEAYVQLGMPADLDEAELLGLADGFAAVAAAARVAVAGGDLVAAPSLFVAVTVVGHAGAPEALVRRAGARPGDVVAITGELGGAAAGLRLLDDARLGARLDAAAAAALRERQLRPEPRLEAGHALALAGASAMIDVSDGVAGDARHLAAASGVLIEIDAEHLPLQAGVAEVAAAAGEEPAVFALRGGEDYELLAALAPEALARARAALAPLGLALTPIGRVRPGEGVALLGPTGDAIEVTGYDQVRSRARGGPT